MNFGTLRTLLGDIGLRGALARAAGITFGGKRDLYTALGYERDLTAQMYRARYNRGGLAGRVVDAKPDDTWAEGVEIVETEDSSEVTTFEQAFDTLDERLNIFSTFHQVDKLSGVGRYGVILIGAPGKLQDPLFKVSSPEQIAYLAVYGEDECTFNEEDLETNTASRRFGMPNIYRIKRLDLKKRNVEVLVHYTRIVHVADERLDDRLFGRPRLERVWNYLDDLDKVVGGGAEAFWRRADRGMQIDLDKEVAKEIQMNATAQGKPQTALDEQMEEEVDKYIHGLSRVMRTIGTKVTEFSADVADFGGPVTSIVGLIAATTQIPQRILLGSERGELASSQDDDNWQGRIDSRRARYAAPFIVKPFVDRLIELKALPEPQEYSVRWPDANELSELERAQYAAALSKLNMQQGEIVVTANEIRDRALGWERLEENGDSNALQPVDQGNLPTEQPNDPAAEQRLRAAFARKVWKGTTTILKGSSKRRRAKRESLQPRAVTPA